MRKFLSLLAALTTVAAGSLVYVSGSAPGAAAAAPKYGGVVTIAGSWGSILNDFNPLTPGNTGTTAAGTLSLLYEPLFYNNVGTGKVTPLLGTAIKWEDNNLKFVVTTRTGVQWSDGTAFSAADVAFTFNYLKKYPVLDSNAIWQTPLKSVTVTGPNTVTFTLSSPYTPIAALLMIQEIVPEHLWSAITNPATYTNPHPVGTGPFLLKSITSQSVTYVKNPHYWMPGLPYINGVTMVAVKNNETTELLLYSGRADWIGGPITDVEKTGAKYPAVTWWWPADNINMLYFNTQEAPFNNVAVRKGIAQALNPTVITDRAYYGAVGTANETLVLDGQLSQWVPPSVKALEWGYSPSAALATLEKAGYKVVGGKLESPSGTALPTLSLLVGSGWTDFISIAQTISEELQAIGISTTVVQEPYATYASSLTTGHYDMAVSWGNNSNVTPYYLYYYLLSSKQSAAPGKATGTDWERFSTPAVDAALSSYASTSNLALQKQDMATIERVVLTQVPAVALTARPNWSNFSTKSFTGWPRAADPYNNSEPPDFYGGGGELVYLHVHLK